MKTIPKNKEDEVLDKARSMFGIDGNATMGTDIKELMSHKEIRDDFKYMLRKNIDLIFEKINKE